MSRRKAPWAFALPGLLAMAGCSVFPRVDASIKEFSRGVYEKTRAAEAAATAPAVPEGVSFEEALRMMVRASPDLPPLRAAWEKDRLLYQQAKTKVYPRISANVNDRTVFSPATGSTHSILDGGIGIDYNVMDLFFASDLTAAEKQTVAKDLTRGRGFVQSSGEQLLAALLEIDLNGRLRPLYEGLRSSAAGGRAEAERALAAGTIGALDFLAWDKAVQNAEERVAEGRADSLRARRRLGALLGVGGEPALAVRDFRGFVPSEPADSPAETAPADSLDRAWRNRGEVQMAEIDLLVAEVDVARIKNSWTDYFRISLGLGKYYDYRSNEYAGLSVNASFSLPIFDLGDRRRKIKAAEIERDAKRAGIEAAGRRIADEIRAATDDVAEARRKSDSARRWRERMAQGEKLVQTLIGKGEATVLDYDRQRIDALEAEIQFQRSVFELERALIRQRLAEGRLVELPLCERVLTAALEGKEQP
ncbi:MAG: TolC family protein [Acidobacteriota bacterium]|nr:TolC family protein [Acidobacteriota bacterium]